MMQSPRIPMEVDSKKLAEARALAERYHSQKLVLDAGGYLMKESKAQSIMQFGRKVKNLRWFRLLYDTEKLTWILRWYENDDEENLLSSCPLTTAKVKIVNDSRSVTVGSMITSLDVNIEFPAKKSYRLFTTGDNPREGANLLTRIESVIRKGAHNPEMPSDRPIIEFLYAEALERNNIKQSVAARMRQSMPLNQKWSYVVRSWTTEEDVTRGVMPWVAAVTEWPALSGRLIDDRKRVDNLIETALKDRKKPMWSQLVKEQNVLASEWASCIRKMEDLHHHWKSMAQGFRPWLQMFTQLGGVSKIVKACERFADRGTSSLSGYERKALHVLVQLMYDLIEDQVGIGLVMDTPDAVEVLVLILGSDQLHDESLSSKIVSMLTVCVFESEDAIGTEDMRRGDDPTYTPSMRAAVPQRVADAFVALQGRARELHAFGGFSSALRHAKSLETSMNYLQLITQLLSTTKSLKKRMRLWEHFRKVDIIGACYNVVKRWRALIKEGNMPRVELAKTEGALTDFDLNLNDELLYMRNEDMKSHSAQFHAVGIDKLMGEFKACMAPRIEKNISVMLRNMCISLSTTADTPFGEKLTAALAKQAGIAASCVYAGNVDALKLSGADRDQLIEQYKSDETDRQYKQKALRRKLDDALERVKVAEARKNEVEDTLANKIAENIALGEKVSQHAQVVKGLEGEIAVHRERVSKMSEDQMRIQMNISKRESDYKSLLEAKNALQAQLTQSRKSRAASIAATGDEHESQVMELELSLARKDAEIQTVRKKFTNLEAEVGTLRTELAKAKKELEERPTVEVQVRSDKTSVVNPDTSSSASAAVSGGTGATKESDASVAKTEKDDNDDTAAVPEGFKPDFCPLIRVFTTSKHMKRWKDVKSLAKGKPLGQKPEEVTADTANEFVETFIPAVKTALKAKSADGKIKMKAVKAYLKPFSTPPATKSTNSSGGGGGGGGNTPIEGSDDVTRHFNLYSPDQNGQLSPQSISKTLSMIFQALYTAEPACKTYFKRDFLDLAEQISVGMVDMADEDKNGLLSIDEFKKFFKPKEKTPMQKLKEEPRYYKWVRLKSMISSLSETNMRGKMKSSGSLTPKEIDMICSILFPKDSEDDASEGGAKKSSESAPKRVKPAVVSQCKMNNFRWLKLKEKKISSGIWGVSSLSDSWALDVFSRSGQMWSEITESGAKPSTPRGDDGQSVQFTVSVAGKTYTVNAKTSMMASLALERGFAAETKQSSRKSSSSSGGKTPSKKKGAKKKKAAKLSFVKCRMQVEVGMRKWMKDGPALRKAFLAMDDEIMTLPLVKKLLALNRGKQNDPNEGGEAKFPDTATIAKLQSKRDEELANADKFLKILLVGIPRPYDRLLCFESVMDLPTVVEETTEKASTLETCASVVLSSRRFKILLELVLATGNYLNSSNKQLGGCYGFDILNTLEKVPTFKTSDKSSSLAEWLVKFADAILPEEELHKLGEEWEMLSKVISILPRDLKKTIQTSRQRVMQLEAECSLEHADPADKLESVGSTLVGPMTKKIDKLESIVSKARKKFDSMVTVLGQDPSDLSDAKSYSEFWTRIIAIPDMLAAAKEDVDAAKAQRARMSARRSSLRQGKSAGASKTAAPSDQSTFARFKERRKAGARRNRGFRLPGL